MSEDILVNITPQETRVAIVQQAAVQELHIERTLTRGLVGNIYLGKVVRVLPGMQSAFIDIGLERAAFLHAQAGLDATRASTHWMGTHWLASFAVYVPERYENRFVNRRFPIDIAQDWLTA